jgi:hypothetical protein
VIVSLDDFSDVIARGDGSEPRRSLDEFLTDEERAVVATLTRSPTLDEALCDPELFALFVAGYGELISEGA